VDLAVEVGFDCHDCLLLLDKKTDCNQGTAAATASGWCCLD
jgi:hypothetical protein